MVKQHFTDSNSLNYTVYLKKTGMLFKNRTSQVFTHINRVRLTKFDLILMNTVSLIHDTRVILWVARPHYNIMHLIIEYSQRLIWHYFRQKNVNKKSLLLLGSQIVGEPCDNIHFNIYISFKKHNSN